MNNNILNGKWGLCLIALLFGMVLPGYATKKPSAYQGYLFAYFEGTGPKEEQEQLRFAYSADAKNWYALNNNRPVLHSKDISKTGGIRDPHILRRIDGKGFYMVATDMAAVMNGWEHNPGIVMLKSDNLVDWSHNVIDLASLYPERFGNVKWVWAPQTIYDQDAKKYLVYFTIRFKGDEHLDFYSAYANKDFTGFEAEPTLMFRAKYGAIDGDIIYKDGIYHFFYKGNTKDKNGKELKNGIQQATSKSLKGPWKENFKYVDAYADTSTMVEGSGIFKLNDSDEYILMYDLYTSGRYEFQRSKDLYTFTSKPESFTKNFYPRHGSVMSITQEEAYRLNMKWGGIPQEALNEPLDFVANGNPIVTHKYTADPAPLVMGDTLWLYTGHDFAGKQNGYKMRDWCLFSTTDMIHWTEHPTPLKLSEFAWDRSGAAYASHVAGRNGKYYFYASTNGSGIGVAVADNPRGPFKDALGKPLLTNKDCPGAAHWWVCIDPAVFIDDDGQAWIFWGNKICYCAKLKENMTEIDGVVHTVDIQHTGRDMKFTEAPWVHKHKGKYYLTYASGFPEKISYAMADKIEGPYTCKGILAEMSGNSNTTHPGIVEFKGQAYFFTHNGGLPDGGSYSRSVCAEFLRYNADGTMRKVEASTEGADRGFVPFDNKNNPVIPGYNADPEVMYSHKTGKYYIYPTSDGFHEWNGHYFKAFSSSDLKHWKDEGVIFDFRKDLAWADKNAWAPTIVERKINGEYRYFYYYSAEKKIGVAVSNSPTGPFKDPIGKPLIDYKPEGVRGGQQIDPDVFQDPQTGKYYIYWGCGYLAVAELNDDMVSVKKETMKLITPKSPFTEGTEVFYRNGLYYFLWSENDTRSEDYRVRYATAKLPIGPLEVPDKNLILWKRPEKGIYGTGHNAVLKVNGKDEWYIVYHRFRRPNAIKMGWAAGYHREVCMDKMEFETDGKIKVIEPTL